MPAIVSYLDRQVARHAASVLEHMAGARRGADPEDLHIVRVSSRRLRETLRALNQVSPSRKLERSCAAIRKITRAAGRMRELDVAREYLRSRQSSIPPPTRRALRREIDSILRRWIRAQRSRLRGALNPVEFRRLAKVADEATTPPSTDESMTARDIVKKRLNQSAGEFREIRGRDDVRRLHLFRIAIKKLRYAVEILEPFLRPRWSSRLRRIKKLQGLLGRLHDDCVTAKIFRMAARMAGAPAREPMRQADLALKKDYKRQFRRLKHMRMPWEA